MSYSIREPSLHATPVLELRPTQMTLGMNEVTLKRKSWKTENRKKLIDFLGHHMVPVIIGPGQQRFLIDHHHLARALHDEGVDSVFVTIVADLHRLEPHDFWNMMDFRGWTHPYDGKGRRRDYADLPKTVKDMEDDPYRSLAGELRNIGGFAKDLTPFSEFVCKAIRESLTEGADESIRRIFIPINCGSLGCSSTPFGLSGPSQAPGGVQIHCD